MSLYGPVSAFLLVGGRNISGDTFNLEETVESVLEETHGLGEAWEESLPVGLGRITLDAAGGIYDDRVGGIMEALQSKGTTKQLLGYGMSGTAVGAEVVMIDGTYAATWKRIASREGLTKAHAVHRLTGGYRQGRVLHGLTTIITNPNPGYGTSIDQHASPRLPAVAITSSSIAAASVITCPAPHGLSNNELVVITGHSGSTPSLNAGDGHIVTVTGLNTFTIPVTVSAGGTGGTFKKVSSVGAIADLHIPAITLGGFTSLTVKVQHSADNASFVDLMTFATAAGITAERKSVVTQVNRFVRMSWTWVGAGSAYSAIPYVAFGRPLGTQLEVLLPSPSVSPSASGSPSASRSPSSSNSASYSPSSSASPSI